MTSIRRWSFLGWLMVLGAVLPAGAETVTIHDATLDVPSGWEVVERVDGVTLQSVTLQQGEMILVLATGPAAGEFALDDVSTMAQDRLNAVLPMLLEDHRRLRFKVGGLKAKGHKGLGTTWEGEDLPVECGAAISPELAVAVCAAAPRKQMRAVINGIRQDVTLGGGAAVLEADDTLAFDGSSLPVPAGWDAIIVEGEIVPFAYLSQKQGGSLRMAKIPAAVAALPIPWEKAAGVVARLVASSHGDTQGSAQVDQITVCGVPSTRVAFRVTLEDRLGWVVLVYPAGRRDMALLGISKSPGFDAWFDTYLGQLTVDAEAGEPLEMPSNEELLESLDQVLPGASEILELYLQNLSEANAERAEGEGGGEEGAGEDETAP